MKIIKKQLSAILNFKMASKINLSDASRFLTPKYMGVDTKIMFLSVPEVKLCQLVGF